MQPVRLQEDDRPASRNFRGLQVIRLAQVAHEAKGKAKIAAMQECYSTCFLRIMTPIQARRAASAPPRTNCHAVCRLHVLCFEGSS